MKSMKHHPAADTFPMMDATRFKELVDDINSNGLLQPIVVCDGQILDGRNRFKACQELGIEAKTENYTGDPWQYAWSLNGCRRDLVAEQRYLCWKHCHENSEEWQAEQKRIQAEANKKRSEAAKAQPRTETGFAEKQVVGQSVPPPDKQHKAKQAKAAASKTNLGAVARGDKLAKERPDLAEQVRLGEIKPAEAHRQMKRDEAAEKLEEIMRRDVSEPTGEFDVIVIDPPWPMQKIERDERPNQVAFDYPVMSEHEIKAISLPAAEDCHVWVWTTQKFLPMALRCIDHWGLKYVCTFVWHKPGGPQPFNLPQYNCEFAIYCRKGTPEFFDTKAFNTCFNAPRGKHSEKPEQFYEVLRRVTKGRRLDMFNRRKIDGFMGWGNESLER